MLFLALSMSFVKNILFITAVFLINNRCSAQQHLMQISGIVEDSINRTPLNHASVYLSNTTIGTTTSRKGAFTLTNIPPGHYNLVISYLGFTDKIIPVNEQNNGKTYKVKLARNITRLKGLTITTRRQNKTYLAIFGKYFIGTDENAKQCEILNPEVLFFNLDSAAKMFNAHADKPLVVLNKALGYKIYYDLQYFHFNFDTDYLAYFGYPKFEPLSPRNKRQQRTWEQNRFKTYMGSMRHFMESLIRHQLKKDGFEVKKLLTIKDPYFNRINHAVSSTPLPYDSIITPAKNKPGYVKLKFKDSLYITYDPPTSTGISPKIKIVISPVLTKTNPRYPPSILILTKPQTYIDRNGVLTDPVAVTKKGGWANRQVADLLPYNYQIP